MEKKQIIKYVTSILVVGVTATTAMYITKKILVNSISKRTGQDKKMLDEKNIIELYKIKTKLPPNIIDETKPESKGILAALKKASEKIKVELDKDSKKSTDESEVKNG